jgi:hypothetical protein
MKDRRLIVQCAGVLMGQVDSGDLVRAAAAATVVELEEAALSLASLAVWLRVQASSSSARSSSGSSGGDVGAGLPGLV